MNNPDPLSDSLDSQELRQLQMFIYFVPIVGVFPALWTVYRRQGNRRQQIASRLSVTLGLTWLLGYLLLGAGATGTGSSVTFLMLNSLLTSSYFVVSIWLMVRLWHRKSVWLPGLSDIGDRLP